VMLGGEILFGLLKIHVRFFLGRNFSWVFFIFGGEISPGFFLFLGDGGQHSGLYLVHQNVRVFLGGLPTVVVSLGGDPSGEPTGVPNGVPVAGRYASGVVIIGLGIRVRVPFFTGEYGGEQNWALASQVTEGDRLGVLGTGSVSR